MSEPAKMTEAQLRGRISWHMSFAVMFRERSEDSMARQFFQLAMGYGAEMERRGLSYEVPPLPVGMERFTPAPPITRADIYRAKGWMG
jgi:hypothetical protein